MKEKLAMCEHQQGIVSVLYLEKMNVDNGLCMLCQKEVVLESDFHRMSGPYACDKRGLPGHIQYPKDGGYCWQMDLVVKM